MWMRCFCGYMEIQKLYSMNDVFFYFNIYVCKLNSSYEENFPNMLNLQQDYLAILCHCSFN